MSIAVEIAVQDEDGLVVAAHAGADRVELCADLSRGGATAPLDLVERCCARAAELVASRDAKPQFDVHVLIRPPAESADILGRPDLFAVAPAQVRAMAADGILDVCAGGGVRPVDIAPLVRATGVADIHLSARGSGVGAAPGPGTVTDPAVAVAAVDAAGAL